MTYFYNDEAYEIINKHNANGRLIDKILTENNSPYEVFLYESENKDKIDIVIAIRKGNI